jgi:protein PsiE
MQGGRAGGIDQDAIRRAGRRTSLLISDLGLCVVLLATVVAGTMEVWKMIEARAVTLTDILLLFIYLEVITMVDVYWRSGKLPVRMPLYIAMVALARYIILEAAHINAWQVVGLTVAILVLALAVLVVRFGHLKLPYPETESHDEGLDTRDARKRDRPTGSG